MSKYHSIIFALLSLHSINGMDRPALEGETKSHFYASCHALSHVSRTKKDDTILLIDVSDDVLLTYCVKKVPDGCVGIDCSPKNRGPLDGTRFLWLWAMETEDVSEKNRHERKFISAREIAINTEHSVNNIEGLLRHTREEGARDKLHQAKMLALASERLACEAIGASMKFNYAVVNFALSGVKNQLKMYQKIENYLVSGGTMVALILANDDPVIGALLSVTKNVKWQKHFEGHAPQLYPSDKQDIAKYLAATNFKIVKLRKAAIDPIKLNGKDFAETLHGNLGVENKFIEREQAVCDCRDSVQEKRRYRDFVNDVMNEYLTKNPLNEAGNFLLNLGCFLVIAEKQ